MNVTGLNQVIWGVNMQVVMEVSVTSERESSQLRSLPSTMTEEGSSVTLRLVRNSWDAWGAELRAHPRHHPIYPSSQYQNAFNSQSHPQSRASSLPPGWNHEHEQAIVIHVTSLNRSQIKLNFA